MKDGKGKIAQYPNNIIKHIFMKELLLTKRLAYCLRSLLLQSSKKYVCLWFFAETAQAK